MAFIKVNTNGAIQFVDELQSTKLTSLKRDFYGEADLNADGTVKKFTADEVAAYFGAVDPVTTANDIFGKPVAPASITIPSGGETPTK